MTSHWPEVPDFGAQLASCIAAVPPEGLPVLLAGLERAAAARYRSWAEQLPDHAGVLNECAAREDRIATLVSDAFPISEACSAAVNDALPSGTEIYYEIFEGHSILQQIYIQSEAELQGARAWAGISAQVDDPSVVVALDRCAELEEASSRAAKALLDEIA
jgi:hypothetical protein